MSNNSTKYIQPSKEYLELAVSQPDLLRLWGRADGYNRRFGNRNWDHVWYGMGRHLFGMKDQMRGLVGWDTPSGVHPKLRTSEAYSIVYQELIKVLQRSKKAVAHTKEFDTSGPILRLCETESTLAAKERAHVQAIIDTLYPTTMEECV